MQRYILIAAIGVLWSTQLIAATDLNQAAQDACLCLEDPYLKVSKVLIELEEAKQSGDVEKLLESKRRVIDILSESSVCFANLSNKYPEIDLSDEMKKQVIDKIEQMCPNPALSQ